MQLTDRERQLVEILVTVTTMAAVAPYSPPPSMTIL